ncbi:putative Amidohydrolase family protein; hippurate hydrolase (Benzoylglycine amidohydrolase) [Bradyrhizobium sp. ORS 285]|uniref:M20 aminoacylase family protein n=1 Tax=Bradyrhizobium sp. ORS 285 TaxID=115808 RepID=UPI0002407941|nr:M20 aminoacylase family protein [Bradyrhizobium sp. ORS 285]CCD88530.1 putative Amidohydrolase family protein; hippurate hydrolase (Benzoylglycine amidohydrolase) [Bradyrhizobium sp. ORS 285]SMX59545.1 putative Amidohydrolase family protein; hippurate hydrolase (Benzoylglycine amidohydrolase) [Bradyrhizobium sp. ORS 285]
MPIVNRVADLQPDIQAWRRDIHSHPELLYEVHRTAAFVADRLREFGCDEVVTGLGKTGVVGVIKGRKPGNGDVKVLGLRADMDALPIEEITGLPYASKTPGMMHACGHDGHTAMLLGAARYLAETRNFAGEVAVIFQPAEEGGGGADAMIKDGLIDRFKIDQVYGMHNGPGLPVGAFAIRQGPLMASTDSVDITIEGHGGHAAKPHNCIDSLMVGAQLVTALQQVVARNVDPLEAAVLSICEFHAGNARNVIPQSAVLRGTVRTLTPKVRELMEKRVREVVSGVAQMTGAKIDLAYTRGYPVVVNHAEQTEIAIRAAKEVAGDANVHEMPPMMGGEDFAYMLEARPGAFIFVGNGDSAGLHHPAYNFNDEAIVYGTSFFIKVVENTLAA